MPEPFRLGDLILVRGTDTVYIECLNEDNYVTVFYIVGINAEIVPQNQCCQVPIVEGTGSRSGHMHKISSAPNQHTLPRISSQSTQTEEADSGI